MAQATEARPNVRQSALDLYGMRDQLRGGELEREDSLSFAVGVKNAGKVLAVLLVMVWVAWRIAQWVSE